MLIDLLRREKPAATAAQDAHTTHVPHQPSSKADARMLLSSKHPIKDHDGKITFRSILIDTVYHRAPGYEAAAIFSMRSRNL
eukprot:7267817-Prymnesium_polylepis.2